MGGGLGGTGHRDVLGVKALANTVYIGSIAAMYKSLILLPVIGLKGSFQFQRVMYFLPAYLNIR